MSVDPGAATGRGRPAAVPAPGYEHSPAVSGGPDGPEVVFTGEDGRTATFSISPYPCPGLHEDLLAAFARLVGPTGTVRTLASAQSLWHPLRRFLKFLGDMHPVPSTMRGIRRSHLDWHRNFLGHTNNGGSRDRQMGMLFQLVREIPVDRLDPGVAVYVRRPRWAFVAAEGQPGYSDAEWRRITAAARRDVAGIRNRITASERLMHAAQDDPDTMTPGQAAQARELQELADTGRIPDSVSMLPGGPATDYAKRLFLLHADLAPLTVLMVALTGRNVETVKELAAEHTVLEDRAVRLTVVKRRRGKSRMHETVHWEIGPPSRQLHTPGGLYLLIHSLTAHGRRFSGSERLWSIWTYLGRAQGQDREHRLRTGGHIDPYAAALTRDLDLSVWAARHGLLTDDGGPLALTLNRLKTTVEVRLTRELGGHLPSASRTNTMDVSFRNYLRGDPAVKDWAATVMTEALEDAENSVRHYIARILDPALESDLAHDPGRAAAALGVSEATAEAVASGELDTAFASCLDHDHSPHNGGGACSVSFLTCLRCPNALIAERHLPGLVALRDGLQQQLQARTVDDWTRRHGVTWTILTAHILPRFTPAQTAAAERQPVPAAELTGLLSLLDEPTESP